MSRNKLGKDSHLQKFIHLKIRHRDGNESLTMLEEGEFKITIDGCIINFIILLFLEIQSSHINQTHLDQHYFFSKQLSVPETLVV